MGKGHASVAHKISGKGRVASGEWVAWMKRSVIRVDNTAGSLDEAQRNPGR